MPRWAGFLQASSGQWWGRRARHLIGCKSARQQLFSQSTQIEPLGRVFFAIGCQSCIFLYGVISHHTELHSACSVQNLCGLFSEDGLTEPRVRVNCEEGWFVDMGLGGGNNRESRHGHTAMVRAQVLIH